MVLLPLAFCGYEMQTAFARRPAPAAPARRRGLQPGGARWRTVWPGTAAGGGRIAKGILHALQRGFYMLNGMSTGSPRLCYDAGAHAHSGTTTDREALGCPGLPRGRR